MRFSRKKSKPGSCGRETCCTRLLWNANGHWKDNWFTYEDGTLSGYREQGVKPAEVSIKMTTSKLTVYGADGFMRKLNLFKITTVYNVAHVFAAWTEEEYETWIDILSYVVGKKSEQVSFNMGTDRCIDEECYDNDIIPYDEGNLTRSHRKDNGKQLTDSRGESIDSGNDGDESGLESSVSSLFESRRRIEMERKEFGRTVSHSSIPEITSTPERNSFIRCSSEKDIVSMRTQHRDNHNNNKRAPTSYCQGYPQREIYTKNEKNQRPTSYPTPVNAMFDHRYQRTPSPSDHPIVASSLKVPEGPTSRKSRQIHSTTEDCISSNPEYYVTAENVRHHVRQCSTDTYLHLNDVAIDSTTSPTQTIDVVDTQLASRSKASVASYSEDSGSTHAHTIGEVRQKLEDSLREETLLRRRRNSLNLELDLMKGKLEELKGTSQISSASSTHHHNHNDNIINNNNNNSSKVTCSIKDLSNCDNAASERLKHIEMLEKKAANIENEIKIIDSRISVSVVDPTTLAGYGTTDKKRKTSLMKRFRSGKTKDPGSLVHTCSMSVESLTSTASHDSSVGRESPYLRFKSDSARSAMDSDRHSYIPSVSSVDEQTDNGQGNQKGMSGVSLAKCSSPVQSGSPVSVYGTSPSGLNGLETLLRTTELLETGEFLMLNKRDSTSSNGDFSNSNKRDSTSSESDPIQFSVRSKSMSAVDKIKAAKTPLGKTDSSPLNSNNVDVIIEDFEKFSAMLMQTHHMKASGQIIDV